MNSMAQHAVTNGYGKSENLRAQPTSSSFLVVRYSNAPLFTLADAMGMVRAARASIVLFRDGFEQPCLVDVREDEQQQRDEDAEEREHRTRHRLRAQCPDEQEHGLEIEQDEDDRHRVVLDRHGLDVE